MQRGANLLHILRGTQAMCSKPSQHGFPSLYRGKGLSFENG